MGGHRYIMALIRGLKSPLVEKIIESGLEKAAPHYGEMIIKGSNFLNKFLPKEITEKASDIALRAYGQIPGAINSLLEANATIVPPNMADYAPAFLGDAGGQTMGDGKLLWGNDQPMELLKKSAINIYDRDLNPQRLYQHMAKTRYYKQDIQPMGAENSFVERNYNKPPANASEAGWYFRKVGRGTNIVNNAPGFGEILHEPAKQKKEEISKDFKLQPSEKIIIEKVAKKKEEDSKSGKKKKEDSKSSKKKKKYVKKL